MKKSLWTIMSILAIGVSLYAFSYLFLHHDFLNGKGDLQHDKIWQTAFHFHFIGGAIALLVGWIQFSPKIRNKYFQIHRSLGLIYVISIVFFGSVGGLYLAYYAIGGFSNSLGFAMMDIIWFGFTLMAFISIKRRNISAHEKWMIRSYAVTYAAVMLRIWLPIFQMGMGLEFEEAYAAVSWFCWVPNLFVAEWIISALQTYRK